MGFEVWLSESYVFILVFSWVVYYENVLGVLVLIVSYNFVNYLGLKVKGVFGGFVGSDVIEKIEV